MGTAAQMMEVVQGRDGLLDGRCLYPLRAGKNKVVTRSLKV